MKNFKVKVADRVFEVEVGDLRAIPVQVHVDGETFEVWPEADNQPATTAVVVEKPATSPAAAPAPRPAAVQPTVNNHHSGGNGSKTVFAPIPGVITSISVQPGAVVKAGQELCVLEAMKMKNSIRATRDGEIAAIHVSVGQQVKHRDLLMEYKS